MRGITVTDASVRRAMKIAFERMKLVLEPSGAASLAALLDGGLDVAGKTVLVVATGGNVSLADFMEHVDRCLRRTSSSSAPARPARPWPTACRRTASIRVIVIEYGGSDFGPLIQMPSALSIPMNMSRYDWGFRTEPEPHLGGRVLATPRGKVIGGSSSINGMVYVRGHARDFDHWAEQGATGWALRRRAALFQAHGERRRRRGRLARHRRAAARPARASALNPLYAAFIEAGRQAGFETDRRLQRLQAGRLRRRWSRPSITAAAGPPPTPISGRR